MIGLRGMMGWGLLLASTGALAQIEVREPVLQGDEYAELASELHASGVLQEFAADINEEITLPTKVGVRFAQCGQVNAFYHPAEQQITLCFELLEHYGNTLAAAYQDEAALDAAVGGAYMVVLFHELGHALVHVLELPITGKEEDAVDQLAAWALIDDDSGDDAVLDAALTYYVNSEQSGAAFNNTQFADEHSLGPQRFYNLMCWVYGSNPEKHLGLVGEGGLPEARAQRCPHEYAQIDSSWSRLLEAAGE